MFRLPSAPGIPVPAGACDCHMHILGPLDRYPPTARRSYTPRPATIGDYLPIADRLGLTNIVVVTPHAYGTDNSSTMDAVAALGPRSRAVVVVDEQASDTMLADLYQAGARGVRFNLLSAGDIPPAQAARTFATLAPRLKAAGLHAQIYMRAIEIPQVAAVIEQASVPVVFDHMGSPDVRQDPGEAGFRQLLKLLASGRAWVKLSGLFHLFHSDDAGVHPRIRPFVEALVAANPEQLLFGTDWPHVGRPASYKGSDAPPVEFRPSDDGRDMSTILGYVKDAKIVQRILRDNPARLYGFD